MLRYLLLELCFLIDFLVRLEFFLKAQYSIANISQISVMGKPDFSLHLTLETCKQSDSFCLAKILSFLPINLFKGILLKHSKQLKML